MPFFRHLHAGDAPFDQPHADHPAGEILRRDPYGVERDIGVGIGLGQLRRQFGERFAARFAAKERGRNRTVVMDREYETLRTGVFRVKRRQENVAA